MTKRILSLLLALVMVLGMFPAPVFATDSPEATASPTEIPTEAATQPQTEAAAISETESAVAKETEPSSATEPTTAKETEPSSVTEPTTVRETEFTESVEPENIEISASTSNSAALSNAEKSSCDCPMTDGLHYATCPNYICPSCGTGPWHEICPETGEELTACETCGNDPCTCEGKDEEAEGSHPMLGKTVALVEDSGLLSAIENPVVSTSGSIVGKAAYPEHMEIEAVVTVGTTVYYQLKAAKGYAWPDYFGSCYEHYWLPSTQLEEVKLACPICGNADCTTEHILCDICGAYDCSTVHIYCQICGKYDCGQAHLFCLACEVYDCTITHTFCGYCNAYDCGIEHMGMNKPAEVPVIPAAPAVAVGADVSIVDENGDPVTDLFLAQGMRSSLSAWSSLENASYQWQIRYDAANDLWEDIQGQNGKGILVSPAMFQSVISDQGSTAVRCVMTSGEQTRISAAIPVSVTESVSADSFAHASGVMLAAETENPDALGKTYVVVQYVYSDGRTAAASDFAELVPGSAYSHTYPLPAVPGYKATLNTHSFGDGAKIEGDALVINIAENVLTEDYTIFTVTYSPDFVDFTVIHYWQNVGDDYYTEHERETVSTEYMTGDLIAEAHKTYPGFYNLLYETPVAAADGSTVIEVYYDRYYYLMRFDLGENGYGVDPIYARYGDSLDIGTPTRAGYTFLGWKLNGEGETIAPANMPTTMPDESRKYVAQWQAVDTAKVSVVFWGENPNDEGYSYIETKELYVKPGISYTFSGNGGLICGTEAHTHDSTCKRACGLTEHSHTQNCYTFVCTNTHTAHTDACWNCGATVHTHNANCYEDVGTASYTGSLGMPENPVEGQVYKGRLSTYIYIGGTWYYYEGSVSSGTASPTCGNTVHTHTDACCGEALHTHTAYTGSCYTLTCTTQTHTHTNTCGDYSCGKVNHTHTSSCYDNLTGLDSELWTFIKSDTVTVAADGSSSVNVYYDRTEFTLTFKVGNTTVKAIKDKWGADIHNLFPIQGDNGTDYKGAEWQVPRNCVNFEYGTNVLSIDIMPPEYITFTRNSQNDDAKLYYYIEVMSEEECSREYNGRHYKLYKTVYLPNSGRLTESEEFHDIAGFTKGDYYPSGIFSSGVKSEMWLYYTRNSYMIKFYNPTNEIGIPALVPFEKNLGSYDWTPTAADAPNLYEPGSVTFAGWYLNDKCTGERFIMSDNTMPSGPNNVNGETALALFAKWEPVEYKVNYYLNRDSLDRGEDIPTEMTRLATAAGRENAEPYATVFAEDVVKHGAYIQDLAAPGVSEGYADIHPRAGYDFVGWFYLNEDGEETAFDPDNMPVDRNLNLYAKWSSNKLCQYNVYFVLDANANGIQDEGENTYVAAPVSGSGIAGHTYTFPAKGGEELYDLGEGQNYREGYFPTVGSHSLVIDIADELGTGANSFTFLYQERQAIPYTVQYVEKASGTKLFDDKVVGNNKNVVVTENFQYKQGYMPDAYQKTLVVTADGENVITFYYTKDEEHALYVVNYYIQDLNADLTHKGWIKYDDLQSTGDIGTSYTAEAITIDGFTLSADYTNQYNVTDKKNGMTGDVLPTLPISVLTNDGKLSGKLSDQGMELNFYYTRNLYPYEFRYMLNGTTTELADPVFGKAGYDTTVTEAYKEIVKDLDGDGVNEDYRLYDPTETTKDIHIIRDGDPLTAGAVVDEGQAKVNVATFYYVRCTQTMTIKKEVVDNSNELDPNPNQEFTIRLLIHATSGYHMSSYAYTKSDGETGTLEPVPSGPNTLQFTLSDGETITIEGLPTAEYTVSELNLPTGYYDTYSPNQRNKLTVDGRLDVVVTNTFEPANLTITKTVNVVENGNMPEVEDFEFTITFPTNVTPAASYSYTVAPLAEGETSPRTAAPNGNSMVITLKKGQTATLTNLPVGIYAVEEADYTAQGYKSRFVVNNVAPLAERNGVDVQMVRGETQAVECINTFPVGDLLIEKTVTKEFYGTQWEGDIFTFTVERTTEGRSLINGNTYDVYEGENRVGTATVADNKLNVNIAFTGEDEDPETTTDAEALQTKNASVIHTYTIKNLPAGTYSVTETKDEDYNQTPSGLVISGLTIPAEETKAQFKNTVKRTRSTMKLTKNLEFKDGYDEGDVDGGVPDFSFTIRLKEDPAAFTGITANYALPNDDGTTATRTETITMSAEGTFEVTLKREETVTIDGLPIGKYDVVEATIPRFANSFTVDGTVIPYEDLEKDSDSNVYVIVDVKTDTVTDVVCTNRFPFDVGNLVIRKIVTREYDRDILPDEAFSFEVTLNQYIDTASEELTYLLVDTTKDPAASTEKTVTAANGVFTIELKNGQYADFKGLDATEVYKVKELYSANDYSVSHTAHMGSLNEDKAVVTDTDNQATDGLTASGEITADKAEIVTFTNRYVRHLGRLTVTKIVTGNLPENDVFIFRIQGTDTASKSVDMEISITGGGSKIICDLPLGNYTVTEITDWSWRYTNSDDTESVDLTVSDPDGTVSFTNAYGENKWLDFETMRDNIFPKAKTN